MGCKGIPLRSVGERSRMGIMLERKFSNWRIGAEAWALWMARGMGRRGCAMLGDANGKNESIGQRPRLAPRFEGRISLAAQRSALSTRLCTYQNNPSHRLVRPRRARHCMLAPSSAARPSLGSPPLARWTLQPPLAPYLARVTPSMFVEGQAARACVRSLAIELLKQRPR